MNPLLFLKKADEVVDAIDRLTDAVDKKQTVVPLFFFVPTSITAEQVHEMMTMVQSEFERAGFELPPPPERPSDG